MPNNQWTDAIREAFAHAPGGTVVLETLELSHPALAEPLYLVKDFQGHTFTLETAQVQYFEPAPFRLQLPSTGQNGLQELALSIDNIDQRVSDVVNTVAASGEAIQVSYRTYLNTAKDAPQNGAPLVLFLSDITVTAEECSGRASFADMINRPFLSVLYNVRTHPGLA